MVEFYLPTFPRFPLRKKEHKSYFGKNRTHDFRTSRSADYLQDATALIITVTFVFTHKTEPLCGGFLDKNHVHAYSIRFWSAWRARCFWFSGKRKMKIEAFSPLPPPPSDICEWCVSLGRVPDVGNPEALVSARSSSAGTVESTSEY